LSETPFEAGGIIDLRKIVGVPLSSLKIWLDAMQALGGAFGSRLGAAQ
jgi:hypothetical protein